MDDFQRDYKHVLRSPAAHAPRMSGVYWTLYIEVLFMRSFLAMVLRSARDCPSTLFFDCSLCHLLARRGNNKRGAILRGLLLSRMQLGAWKRNTVSGITMFVTLVTIVVASSVLPIVAPWLGLVPLVCAASLSWIALQYRVRFALLEVFGNVSYSWYLLHPIVGYWVMAALQSLGIWQSATFGAIVSFLASLTFAFDRGPAH